MNCFHDFSADTILVRPDFVAGVTEPGLSGRAKQAPRLSRFSRVRARRAVFTCSAPIDARRECAEALIREDTGRKCGQATFTRDLMCLDFRDRALALPVGSLFFLFYFLFKFFSLVREPRLFGLRAGKLCVTTCAHVINHPTRVQMDTGAEDMRPPTQPTILSFFLGQST